MKYNPKMALSIRGTCTHAGTDQISAYRGTCTQAGTDQISAYRGTCTQAGTNQISAYRGTCTQAGTDQISAYRGTCTQAGTDQISAYRGTCTQAGTNQISAYRTRLHDVFTLTESSGFLTMPGLLSHRLTYICRKPLSSFFFPPEPVVTPPSISSFNLQQKVPHK